MLKSSAIGASCATSASDLAKRVPVNACEDKSGRSERTSSFTWLVYDDALFRLQCFGLVGGNGS